MCKTQQASQIVLVQNCPARQREVKADVSSYRTPLCNMLQRIKNKNRQCKNLILLLNTTRSFPFSEHLRTSRTTSAKIMLVSQAAASRRVRTEATTNWNETKNNKGAKKEKKEMMRKKKRKKRVSVIDRCNSRPAWERGMGREVSAVSSRKLCWM